MHPNSSTLLRQVALVLLGLGVALSAPCNAAADGHADEAKPAQAKKAREIKPAADEPTDLKGHDTAAAKAAPLKKSRSGKAPAADAEDAEDADDAPRAKSATARRTKAEKDAPEAHSNAATPKGAQAKEARDTKGHRTAKGGAEREDPIDRLRERLAERLGAARANDPNVVRVTAHAPPPVATLAKAAPRPVATAKPSGKPHAGAAPGAGHAAHWSYEGAAGPQSWGGLKPEFTKCSVGLRQSPIDIRDGIKVQLDPVQIDYRPSTFRVIDNGHTVQVNLAPGNVIEVIGRRYELLQFHFHRPSEERINGRQFDMVAHLVHKDAEGRLAVIAVLLDRGSAHPVVQTVWNNLPLEKGEEIPAKALIDLNVLLPTERSYFTYMGSLTTPPCSEGVLWMVMKDPVTISAEQIGVFSRLYPMNARPIQSASGRLIKESN
jgi:carbonic anhydrase